MVADLKYREMRPDEIQQVSDMVKAVFDQFVAPGFSQQGVCEFYKYVQPERILQRLQEDLSFILLAENLGNMGNGDKKIVGVIEMKRACHVALLFTDGNYHRLGVAKTLFQLSLDKLRATGLKVNICTVNSSPYAVEAYKRLGFCPTKCEQEKYGVRFVPMEIFFV
ncbi:MAG TPA: GNAT family N-acetyltransferase [Methylomusa anaerophila]|uniref:N-acetyltransferase domain-containing protein n=1 Tax=Methylomusa anaerophila TaxID=1930071 RepID=A0A348ANF2_9FIRM|nr:GNAT family N-acetyltransferase [Methylomusa anaerophila]BBB92600.1 hypothetical protein MAMMFC1_03295 [Methylomusa anaerophila]HML87546.1 GNAT family N-acetyltransferase [Methylomusa anaerophila]